MVNFFDPLPPPLALTLALSLCSFYVTFVVQNHQLNHLPPTDLKNLYHLASSELSLHFTEKTSPVTLTVFLIKLLGNYTRTHAHAHTQTHILLLLLRLRWPEAKEQSESGFSLLDCLQQRYHINPAPPPPSSSLALSYTNDNHILKINNVTLI